MGLPSRDKGSGEAERVIDFGRPEHHPPFADNSVTTSKYSLLSFFPLVSFAGSVLPSYCLCACCVNEAVTGGILLPLFIIIANWFISYNLT